MTESQSLLDVKAVAQLLTCSVRHVYRLVDDGKMPRPVKLGALVRWRREDLLNWLAGGCMAASPSNLDHSENQESER